MAFGLMAILAGCATPQYETSYFNASASQPYTLDSGDRLRVLVYGQDSLSNTYAVDGSGNISVPLIGSVPVRGMTTHAAALALQQRLRAGYLRDPQVSVEVDAYRPFFVLGEVTTAGQYPYINGMTVENAVAVAGGFTPRASHRSATLTRIIHGRAVTATVPMTQLVRPGDTIAVKERFF